MGLRLLVVCIVSVCVCRVGRRQVLSKSLATLVGPLLSRKGQGLPVRGGTGPIARVSVPRRLVLSKSPAILVGPLLSKEGQGLPERVGTALIAGVSVFCRLSGRSHRHSPVGPCCCQQGNLEGRGGSRPDMPKSVVLVVCATYTHQEGPLLLLRSGRRPETGARQGSFLYVVFVCMSP